MDGTFQREHINASILCTLCRGICTPVTYFPTSQSTTHFALGSRVRRLLTAATCYRADALFILVFPDLRLTPVCWELSLHPFTPKGVMVFSRFLRWRLSVAQKKRNRNRVRFDRFARKPPPDVRVDSSGGRKPLTRPPSPRLDPGIEADRPRACSILDVLPLEVRQQIWADVLGGHRFHLEIREAVFVGWLCVSPKSNTCGSGRDDCRRLLYNGDIKLEKNLLLPLLLSCKHIYSEAIRYLYSENVFTTLDEDVMEYLPILLLPQRIDAIRSLTFHWRLIFTPLEVLQQETLETNQQNAGPLITWRTIWRNLSTMKGLQTLNVELDVLKIYWGSINEDTARQLLMPIKDVVRPKEFILSLPFPSMDGSVPLVLNSWSAIDGWDGIDPWDDLPCTIRRVSNFWHPQTI